MGEYNVAGEAREIKRLLEKLGVKVHTVLTGDTRFFGDRATFPGSSESPFLRFNR
ncbi:hypothetical protein [Thermosulfurimonas dismutans]|uniref:hypothetical protein n=1 Tax=Thermosulfurimonas dismutans TaxID=999894 RepID=UPI003CC596F8